jgi:hypothetical protein
MWVLSERHIELFLRHSTSLMVMDFTDPQRVLALSMGAGQASGVA